MNRNLKFVTISLLAWGMGEGMFLLFQPIYLRELGANPLMIGGILGAMGIAMTLAQVPSGYLSDKIGTRPLMWASWVTATIATWLMALANSLPMFTAGLILFGLTNSVLAPMNAYIANAKGDWSTEKALSVTTAAYHLGTVVGPILGGFLGEQVSLRFLYIISAVIFIISTTLVFFIEKIDIAEAGSMEPKSALFKNHRFIRILPLSFLGLFFMFFPQPLTPIYLEEYIGFGLQQIGMLGAIGSMGNVVLALTFGQFKAKIGYLVSFPLVMVFGMLMARTNHFIWVAIAYFCFGGYRLARTMLLALSRQVVKTQEIGTAFGFMEMMNGLVTILAPPLSGLVFARNPQIIYWIAMIGLIISGIINFIGLPKMNKE